LVVTCSEKANLVADAAVAGDLALGEDDIGGDGLQSPYRLQQANLDGLDSVDNQTISSNR
jgi:hypothetical protein